MSQLNSYCNFIDIMTKEGQALVSNAINKFTSPLTGEDQILLNGTHFQKLKDNVLCLGSCFDSDGLFKRVTTVQNFDADCIVTNSNPINMLERYSDENIKLAQKHASFTWGDHSFTVNAMISIQDLTQVDGFLNAAGALTHSKFLGHHICELLTN